jgi:3-dehydroquinate synthase
MANTKNILSSFNVYFETNSFTQLNAFLKKNKFSKIVVIADNKTFELCYPILAENCVAVQSAEIIELESGEQHKTLDTCLLVWQTLSELQIDKNALIINLGGGVITDLGGFIASIYKRGIAFIHIPTTLLAMADASVGGKCGVDLGNIKNQLGTITQANAVFINTQFLNTLPAKHLKNGMSEIIKMGLIADKGLLKTLKEKKSDLESVIKKSVSLKSAIVKKDLNDKGIRKILNFGHTIGHAIESVLLGTKQELLHGEAIAIGMIIEGFISFDKKRITKTELTTLLNLIHPHYPLLQFNKKQMKLIYSFMQQDKKNANNTIRMSLLKGLGNCTFNDEVNQTEIEKAFVNYVTFIAS